MRAGDHQENRLESGEIRLKSWRDAGNPRGCEMAIEEADARISSCDEQFSPAAQSLTQAQRRWRLGEAGVERDRMSRRLQNPRQMEASRA
jgi:hypothetical protein